MANEYLLPIGIDGTKFSEEINKARQIVVQLRDETKRSTDAMTSSFTTAGKAVSTITTETVKATTAVKDESKSISDNNAQLLNTLDVLQKVAVQQGKSFSAEQLNKYATAVKTIQGSLSDVLAKGAANIDPSKIAALDQQLEGITDDAEQFKIVIGFIQDNLNDLQLNPEDTLQLQNYIKLIQSAFAEFDGKPIDIPVKVDTASVTQAAEQVEQSLTITPNITFSEADINTVIQQIQQQVNSNEIDINILSNAVTQGGEILQSLDQESNAYKTLSQSIDLANDKLTQFSQQSKTTTLSIAQLNQQIESKKVELINTTDTAQAAALNKEIATLESQLIALGNAGKEGFDDLGNKIVAAETGTAKLTTRIREITNLLSSGAIAKGSPEFQALITEAAQLTDELGDTRNQIRLLASDTSLLDAGIQAVQGIVGVFAAAQGAMALFGDESEELQKTLLKVNAAMSLLQGLQQAGQLLDKNSALNVFLLKTLRIEQAAATTASAAAEAGLATAETAQAGAATAATTAQEGLNVAMSANPAGILLLSIGTLIGLIEIFTKDTNAAADAQERLNQQLDYNKKFDDDTIAAMKQRGTERIAQMKAQNASEQAIRDEEKKQLQEQLDVFIEDNQKAIDAGEKAAAQIEEIVKNGGKKKVNVTVRNEFGLSKNVETLKKVSDEELKSLEDTANKGLAIQREKDKLASDLNVKELDNVSAHNKELDDARKKANDKAKADYDKSIAIQAAYQQALANLLKQYRNTSIDLISNDRDKQKAQAAAQFQDSIEQVNQLLAQQKKAGRLTAELQAAANNEKSALEKKYTNDVLKIDTDFYKQQADLFKSANDAINEVFETSTQIQIEQAGKKFNDLIKQLDEQNKKILGQKVITPHDAALSQQNYQEEIKLQTAKQNAIDKIVTDSALAQIDAQKQLALDTADQIKSSGLTEEQLTRAKETAKLDIEKAAAAQSLQVLTDLLVKRNKLTQDQVAQLTDPANLQAAAQQKTDIFSLLGLNDKLDADTKQKIQTFLDALNKNVKDTAGKNIDFNLGNFLTSTFFGKGSDAQREAKLFSDAISSAYNEIARSVEISAQRQVNALQEVIDAMDDQISEQENIVQHQKDLSDKGLANDLSNQQTKLDDLKAKKAAEVQAQQQAQERLAKIQKEEAVVQQASVVASNVETGVNMIDAMSKIFKAHAGIPFAGVALAIGFGALMLSTFLAIKNAIKAATSDVPKFRKGGLKRLSIEGPSHEEGGVGLYNEKTGKKLAEYEGGEDLYAVNKESRKKHLPLLKAINDDDEQAILRLVLPKIDIKPFEEMEVLRKVVKDSPKPPMEEIAAVNRTSREVQTIIIQKQMGALNRNDLSQLNHLETIASNTRKRDKAEVTDYGDYIMIKEIGRTRKIWKKKP